MINVFTFTDGVNMGRKKKKKADQKVRTTITLAPDLKAQMDAYDQPVNWSNVAAVAFKDHIAKGASDKEKLTMSEVIARLKASKRETADQNYRWGHDAGVAWASKEASFTELEKLDINCSGIKEADWERFASSANELTVADHFLLRFDPINFDDELDRQSWWTARTNDPDSMSDRSFVQGFAEGALSIWRQVKSQVQE